MYLCPTQLRAGGGSHMLIITGVTGLAAAGGGERQHVPSPKKEHVTLSALSSPSTSFLGEEKETRPRKGVVV
ncbi:hypothetical protein TSOC_007512 [Tetrabaena socialis]|uniref:Uncharacterized protein n=1 Tax=Tetrabaena socialis TaxID=47790 RepID=A0A2J8A0V0_9CHLO|nr:hypothetical protein TSOC_007512 [Tetrabaena socialis]|eukprot:PNH06149.1 hypothetical protein TSOC_007512 [Tetrabaena socialis]